MPRAPRIDTPGALHHVMVRGLERRVIFRDDADRKDFTQRLSRLVSLTSTSIFAWALMPNHAHLLVRSARGGLSTFMQRLLGGYAGGFNRRHNRHGHLLQNRFKSILVEEEPYLLELVRYLHLNPVRGGLVDSLTRLDRYPWTGHSRLMGHTDDSWQDTDFVLAHFGSRLSSARDSYQQFILDGWPQGRRPELEGGGLKRSRFALRRVPQLDRGRERWAFDERILGSTTFVNEVVAQCGSPAAPPRYDGARARRLLRQLVERAAAIWSVDQADIMSSTKRRPVAAARAAVSYVAVVHSGLRLVTVGRFLGVSACTVMRGLHIGKEVLAKRSVHVAHLLTDA